MQKRRSLPIRVGRITVHAQKTARTTNISIAKRRSKRASSRQVLALDARSGRSASTTTGEQSAKRVATLRRHSLQCAPRSAPLRAQMKGAREKREGESGGQSGRSASCHRFDGGPFLSVLPQPFGDAEEKLHPSRAASPPFKTRVGGESTKRSSCVWRGSIYSTNRIRTTTVGAPRRGRVERRKDGNRAPRRPRQLEIQKFRFARLVSRTQTGTRITQTM